MTGGQSPVPVRPSRWYPALGRPGPRLVLGALALVVLLGAECQPVPTPTPGATGGAAPAAMGGSGGAGLGGAGGVAGASPALGLAPGISVYVVPLTVAAVRVGRGVDMRWMAVAVRRAVSARRRWVVIDVVVDEAVPSTDDELALAAVRDLAGDRIVEEAVLQAIDDKPFEPVEGFADLPALGALKRRFVLRFSHCGAVLSCP